MSSEFNVVAISGIQKAKQVYGHIHFGSLKKIF